MVLIRNYLFQVVLLFVIVFNGCGRSSGDSSDASAVESDPSSQKLSGGSQAVEAADPLAGENLRQAALDGDALTVRSLLADGTEIDTPDSEGHTALMFSAFNGHTGIARTLINAGADIHRKDFMGRTALLYAATGPFPETVELLLEKGAEPNIVDQNEHFTPLMHASAEGNLEVVKILVEAGADYTLTDVDGDNAESFARRAGHLEVATYLSALP